MEISTLRSRILVGAFATVMVVGSGVATALVTSNDGPRLGEAVDTTSSTGDTVDVTTPSTPGATTGTAPSGSDGPESDSGGATDGVERYWGPECEGEETTNHGQYVSSQPKDGDSRSEAAQSDCGKPLTSVGDDPEAPADDADAPAAPETVNAGNGNSGNGNSGNGNSGNGNGNGRGNSGR